MHCCQSPLPHGPRAKGSLRSSSTHQTHWPCSCGICTAVCIPKGHPPHHLCLLSPRRWSTQLPPAQKHPHISPMFFNAVSILLYISSHFLNNNKGCWLSCWFNPDSATAQANNICPTDHCLGQNSGRMELKSTPAMPHPNLYSAIIMDSLYKQPGIPAWIPSPNLPQAP